ncbi:MAG TPA: 3-hydroxyacyl-CoA dehydrogenase NAD-binding domain-containing protein [Hyphomicrobiaceae bacterium]|nr:3-hydroxyacyl-CoA dehydrogenase NAD-binding domain-containing protein [Hyphomicrobiaceae bacterium]
MGIVDTEKQGDVAVIRMNNPPVNALGHALRGGLEKAFSDANADAGVKAIVLTGTGRFFSAGADITEFRAPMKEPFLLQIIESIENGPKPVVAAVNGTALGGGLELALGCHYRVAAKDVRQLGLPEIKLGIIPGAGGTQRLPRAIGAERALQLITTGSFIDATKGAAAGLIDKVADGDVVAAAVAFAREQAGKPPRRIGQQKIEKSSIPSGLFDKARASLARHPSGPVAPKAAIDAVEAATTLPIAEGTKRERELFREAAASPYARALQYAFFAERQAANLPGIAADVKLRDVKTVGILGAGTMGTGIGLAFLNAGFPLTIVETTQDALDKGVARIKDTLAANVKRGRATEAQAQERMARLTPSLKLEDLGKADLIIEAVFENMALKKEIFQKLDKIAKSGAILATNTSTLDVDEIAAVTKRPQDVLGMHFFSPANIMRLLEIVRAEKTGNDVMATAMAIAKKIGKVGVQAGVCDGFVGNRMLASYGNEVQAMNLEGAMPQEIDGALEGWGMAMGPLAVSDLAGLDVGYRIRKERKLTGEAAQFARIPDKIVEMGRLGQKTGAGYYKYDENRKRQVDPEIEALIKSEAEALQIRQRSIPADEIVERCLLRLANEGAKILEEGIALRASDIDTMYLNGYGFPAWRGGPMWQVDNVIGMKKAAEKIKAYEAKYGSRWKIAPLIEKLAAENGTFAGLDAKKK